MVDLDPGLAALANRIAAGTAIASSPDVFVDCGSSGEHAKPMPEAGDVCRHEGGLPLLSTD